MDNGFQLDFGDDETGILTEQSDLLLSDDGIVYDQEMMQLFRSMQGGLPGVSPRDLDHEGSFTQSQDSHPPDDYSLDLTDDLEDELASVSVDSAPQPRRGVLSGGPPGVDLEDATTPVPSGEVETQSGTTSLLEFQALEKAMRRASVEETGQETGEDEARLDEFLRDAEKSHVDYSQLLQSQRTGTPTSDEPTRPTGRMSGARLPTVPAPEFDRAHRDSTDFEVEDISGRQRRGEERRALPARPDDEELEMVNVHRRLDDAVDPITVYDRLRDRMDADFEEEKRRSATPKRQTARPGSSESALSADTVKRPRASPAERSRNGGSRASNASGKEKQRSRPASEVEQWVRDQHNATVFSPKPASVSRSRKASDGSEASMGSGIAPLRPSHRLDFGSKQDSASSCDSDDLGSLSLSGRSESKTALKQKLKQEIGKVQQQADQIEQLKNKYGQLLTKHALAEVTIDQLRVNAKVNLDYQLSHSMSDLRGQKRSNSVPNHRAQSVMERTTQIQQTVPEEESGETPNFHSLPPSPIAGRMTEDVALTAARTPPTAAHPDSLRFLAGQLGRRLDAFAGLVAEESLPVADQEDMVTRLREEYDNLHSAYQSTLVKADGFDVERIFEGDLFQLGMRLDDLAERVQTNVRWAKRRTPFSGNQPRMSRSEEVTTATSATTPSTHDPRSPSNTGGGISSGHSTGMSTIRRDGLEEGPNQELGDRLTDLEDQYLRLMSRYNEMKGRMTTPERDRELEALMKELTSISEEAAGLSQVISTPKELAEQFRFDQEASILDQELEQAAAEEQQQQRQQQRRPLDGSPDGGSSPSRQSMSRQGSQSSAGLGLRSEDLEWSSTATTAVQRRGSRSGYTTGTTGGAISDLSGTSSRAPNGRRNSAHRPQYNASFGSRSSMGDSGLSTPVGSPVRTGARRMPVRRGASEVDSGFVGSDSRREQKLRASGARRTSANPLREWSAADPATGPSDASTASTVTRARRATRRSSSLGASGERRALPQRKQSQESRPISATSIESGQSTRLRSLEQDVHWLKEQLTGSQLSLGDVSTHSDLNLDRYDPESSFLTPTVTPDPSRSTSRSRRRRSHSTPATEERAVTRDSRRPVQRSRDRARASRSFADHLDGRELTSDDLLTTDDDVQLEGKGGGRYRRRYEPGQSGPPILKPLRPGHDGVTALRKPGSRGRRSRRSKRGMGVDGLEEEEEEEPPYDPYQRYMSEPFALRRERHGMQSEEEETSTGDEDWPPRRRRSAGSYAYNVPPPPGRGILRPAGHSPMDDFPSPSRRRSRSRSPDVGGGGGRSGWSTRSSVSACPLCGSLGLHTHPGQSESPDLSDDEPAYPMREYITHGAVRYYVREYTQSPPAFPSHSRSLMRSFHDISGLEDEDREVRSINRSRLNESLSDAIRAAQSMSRVASKVRESLRSDVLKSGQRRWTPLPTR